MKNKLTPSEAKELEKTIAFHEKAEMTQMVFYLCGKIEAISNATAQIYSKVSGEDYETIRKTLNETAEELYRLRWQDYSSRIHDITMRKLRDLGLKKDA